MDTHHRTECRERAIRNMGLPNRANSVAALAAIGLLIAVGSTPALAQENAALEEIVVTGSHIRKDTFTSSSPISVVDSSSIEGVGAKNVGELIARIPSIVSAVDGSSVNVNDPQSSGINVTALRNLGASRTLVLVNGRRYVSGTSAGAGYGVDLNTIPTSMIERVEVLTGGQSAAYGSDAVAGVVNIITKTDFEGVALNAQASQSSESDRDQQHIDLTLGKNFDDHNAWVSFGYSNDNGLLSADRDFSRFSQRSIDTDGDGLFDSLAFEGSSFIPETRLIGGGLSIKGDGSPFDGGRDLATTDRLNFNEFRSLLIPLERKFAAAGATLALSQKSSATLEVNYARVDSRARFEPIPYSVVNDAFRVNRGGTTGIDLTTHPLWVGSSAGTQLVAAGVTSLDDVVTFRRTVELGGRGSGNTRTTFRIAAAYNYEFDNGLYFDAYGTYGVTDQVQTDFGDINLERAALALNIEPDGFGGFQCVDPVARINGCVPYNPFNTVDSVAGQAGIVDFSPEAAEYLAAAVGLTGQVEQTVLAGVLSGDLPFSVGDQNNASFALGLEFRDERGEETPDGLRQRGITRGFRIQPTRGSFDVIDVFGEIQIPLMDQLILDAAVRAGDYSSVGSTFTWKVGLDAPVNDSVRLRAAVSTAVRAPNISDLFAGAVANAGLVFDPCNGVDAAATGNVADNCRSIQAIQDRITNTGAFTLTQVESQNTTSFNQGSPNVAEEEARFIHPRCGIHPGGTGWAFHCPRLLRCEDRGRDQDSGGYDHPEPMPRSRAVVVRPDLRWSGVPRSESRPGYSTFRQVANNEDIIETTGIDLEASYLFEDSVPVTCSFHWAPTS